MIGVTAANRLVCLENTAGIIFKSGADTDASRDGAVGVDGRLDLIHSWNCPLTTGDKLPAGQFIGMVVCNGASAIGSRVRLVCFQDSSDLGLVNAKRVVMVLVSG